MTTPRLMAAMMRCRFLSSASSSMSWHRSLASGRWCWSIQRAGHPRTMASTTTQFQLKNTTPGVCSSRRWSAMSLSAYCSSVTKSRSISFVSYPTDSRPLSTAATAPEDSGNHDDVNNKNWTPFHLADIGEGIKEVELLQWYVQVGDNVQQFDTICQVQSDKATVDITSRYTGRLVSLHGHAPGDIVQVGDVLCSLETDEATAAVADTASKSSDTDDSSTDASLASPSSTSMTDSTAQDVHHEDKLHIPTIASHYHLPSDEHAAGSSLQQQEQQRVAASPAVRKLGKEYQLDLSTIHGSGPHGRLLKCDVLTYLQEQGRIKPPSVATTKGKQTPRESSAMDSALRPPQPDLGSDDAEEGTIYTLKGYHRQMVSTMTAALQTPHMCFADEIEMDNLIHCRHELNKNNDEASTKISLLALMLKACSLALTQYPVLNAVVHSVEDCQLKLLPHHDLGVAMDTPRGLVVPSIRRVQEKSVRDIQDELDRLKALAAENQLSMDDLRPASFTLSNIGSIGGTYMQPVIVPPQVGIGAMGRIQKVPRFVEDAPENATVVPVQVMHVSWAGDHRFLDGATLARFNAAFKSYVEDPVLMLAKLK